MNEKGLNWEIVFTSPVTYDGSVAILAHALGRVIVRSVNIWTINYEIIVLTWQIHKLSLDKQNSFIPL